MELLAHKIKAMSGLSDSEYIKIISTYQAMTDRMFNCYHCKKSYPRDEKRQANHQERKGCFEVFPNQLFVYKGENETPMEGSIKVKYYKCPARFYSPSWASIINMENTYSKGIMPFNGSLMDQPAKIVEAFNLIHNLKEETNIKHERVISKHGKRSKR